MSELMHQEINFEVFSRSDPRNWLLFFLGLAFCSIGSVLVFGEMHWMWVSKIFCGLLLLSLSARAMILNRSRGCYFDPKSMELFWWTNKPAGESVFQQSKIGIYKIGEICINNSYDILRVRMYDLENCLVDGFGEWCIPSKYSDWIGALIRINPDINVRRIER